MLVRHGLVALLVAAISWSSPIAQAAVDDPPYLFDADVDPSALPATGGLITTSVSVTDDHGVDQVQALIGDSEGIVMYLDLEPESGSGSRYTGTWTVPSNDSPDPEPYTVWFRAYDDTGAEGNSVSVDFTVAGTPSSTSRLSLSKRRLTFGPVRAGRSVSRTVVLRNRGDEAVECTVRSSARRFRLPGGRERSWTLAPGQAKRVTVRYRSAGAGRHWARLRVVRADGRQPGLRVVMKGTSLRRR